MFMRALLLICTVECIEQTDVILSPEFNDVLENSTLEMACYAPENLRSTVWGTLNQANIFSYLSFSKEGVCTTDGFLNDTKYYETRCYSNATFKVKIKRVDISYHGQEWFCSHQFHKSNTAYISVHVPIKYVKIRNLSGDSLITVEKTKHTLYCETSEGRPAANITWTKVTSEGIRTDISRGKTYAITRKETLTDRNLIIVKSSIDIEPVRDDNMARIVCEATNRKLYVTRAEITIHVHYPPGKPYFQIIGQSELVKNGTVLTNKIALEETSSFNVICKADGYPTPTCTWIVDSDINSSILTFTNISKDATGLYKCSAENIIKGSFPANRVKTNTSSDLEIDVQYQSRVVMFNIIGHEQKEDIIKAAENTTVIFNCSVDSNPESSIALSFRGKELGHVFSAKTLIHTLRITSCFDDGIYKCAAQNNYNKIPSFKELRLYVRCKPSVSPEFDLKSTVSTARNITVTFKFEAIANPTPVFIWFKFSSSWTIVSTSNKYEIHTTGLSSSLSVRSITDDDYGYYKLEIRNEVGSLEQMFFLKAFDTTEEQEEEQEEEDTEELSSSRTLFFVAVGLPVLILLAAVLFFFVYRRRRQGASEREQIQEVNQITTCNNDDIAIYEEIDCAYDHLDARGKENTEYLKMETIETEKSHTDYLIPII